MLGERGSGPKWADVTGLLCRIREEVLSTVTKGGKWQADEALRVLVRRLWVRSPGENAAFEEPWMMQYRVQRASLERAERNQNAAESETLHLSISM